MFGRRCCFHPFLSVYSFERCNKQRDWLPIIFDFIHCTKMWWCSSLWIFNAISIRSSSFNTMIHHKTIRSPNISTRKDWWRRGGFEYLSRLSHGFCLLKRIIVDSTHGPWFHISYHNLTWRSTEGNWLKSIDGHTLPGKISHNYE